MPYDAKPTIDDVILSTWQERDRLHVALHLRKAGDDMGDLVGEWWDGDCAQMFEDGFFKRGDRFKLSDSDRTLAESVLEYASGHGLGALAGFEKGLLDAVATAEGKVVELHDKLAAEHADDEDFDPIQSAAADAITFGSFPAMSDRRIHDVHEYLGDFLEDRLSSAPTP